jgi:hypothetical protein
MTAVYENNFETGVPAEWEQEAVMRELAGALEGFVYYERL